MVIEILGEVFREQQDDVEKMIDKLCFLLVIIFIVGCQTLKPAPWTCPPILNEYETSNPPDNEVCTYNAETGELINNAAS